MKSSKKSLKYGVMRLFSFAPSAIAIAAAVFFVLKFGTPALLKSYIRTGIGDCRKLPVLCMGPTEQINNPPIDKEYVDTLKVFCLEQMQIGLPKEFKAIKQTSSKVYYKKRVRLQSGALAYLLYEPPGFFSGLFPQLAKAGIKNDYDFISRTMGAKTEEIKTLTDAFFVITKGVFTPDLGDQSNVRIAKFSLGDKKGFISYNLGNQENYYDCNIIGNKGAFFKVYIKDKGARLNINKIAAIISTVKQVEE